MKKEKRQQLILKRKNFLPSLMVTVILGLFLSAIVFFTEPHGGFLILLFFVLTFLFLFFLLSLLFVSSKKGLVVSILTTIFLVLRMYGIGNILNAILLLGLAIIAIVYERFAKRDN